jgi:hypothetical protein
VFRRYLQVSVAKDNRLLDGMVARHAVAMKWRLGDEQPPTEGSRQMSVGIHIGASDDDL